MEVPKRDAALLTCSILKFKLSINVKIPSNTQRKQELACVPFPLASALS